MEAEERIAYSRRVLGFLMLACTMILWVSSSVIVQMIFEDVHFEKPVFVTLFNSASSVSLLIPKLARLCRRPFRSEKRDVKEAKAKTSIRYVVQLSSTLGLLWLCAQWMFNFSLEHTSVATNTVLSSTSGVWTFLFLLIVCRDPFRWCSFNAALCSFFGCLLVSLQSPRNVTASAVTNSFFGDVLTLASAALFAFVSVMLRKLAPEEFDLGMFMAVNGLFAICLSPVLLYAAHRYGLESFTPPAGETLVALTLNAVIGCTLANYLYTSALLILSPLVSTVCMSLSIPMSALTDEVVMKQHRFSIGWLTGASLVSLGVVFAAFDLETPNGNARRRENGKYEKEAHLEEELESLLEFSGNGTSDSIPSSKCGAELRGR